MKEAPIEETEDDDYDDDDNMMTVCANKRDQIPSSKTLNMDPY